VVPPQQPHAPPAADNVEFFDSPAAAEAAGYRPSRRARRTASTPPRVAAACARIEACVQAGEPAPGLHALADAAGLSPFHFHRVFKAATGRTPAALGPRAPPPPCARRCRAARA
jgi:AraC family transcriptional regulator of adaptative response/methylated-DNA-[protein]-cysteine methyltransferase